MKSDLRIKFLKWIFLKGGEKNQQENKKNKHQKKLSGIGNSDTNR